MRSFVQFCQIHAAAEIIGMGEIKKADFFEIVGALSCDFGMMQVGQPWGVAPA